MSKSLAQRIIASHFAEGTVQNSLYLTPAYLAAQRIIIG